MSTPTLDEALIAWRTHPAPEIAAAVRALSEAALEDFDGPRARSKADFQEAWLALDADDDSTVATGWLAANLDRLVPEVQDRFGLLRPNFMQEKHAALHARVARLRKRCPDPRIADAALAVLEEGKHGYWDPASVDQIYQPVIRLLLAAEDPAAVDRLREVATSPRSKRATVRQWAQQALPDVVRQLEDLATAPLPADVAQRWASWAPDPPPETSTGLPVDELLVEVYRSPADDGIREVLTDALMDTDDPRGALLALQLGRVPADPDREAKLVRDHQREWIGDDLDDTLVHCAFRRGFLDEAGLRANASASRAVWEAAAADPRIGTIRTLNLNKGNRRNYTRFLLSEHARDLRDIEIPTNKLLDALIEAPVRPLEVLRFPREPRRAVLKKVASAEAFATVHGIRSGTPVDVARLVKELQKTGLAERLTHLGFLADHGERDAPVWDRLDWLADELPQLDTVTLFQGERDATAVRTDDGWTLTLTACEFRGTPVVPDLLHHQWGRLPKLSPVVTKVRVVDMSDEAAALLESQWGRTLERGPADP